MNAETADRRRVIGGGLSLIAATMLFAVVFGYLAVTFDYPDVLNRPASDVLPSLLGLGIAGRIVWLVYGLVPLLLVPTALGIAEVARDSPRLGRTGLWLAVISVVAMMAGLLRWPTLNWGLAQQWTTASAAGRELLAARFAMGNFYLGNVIGELAGELFLNGFFLVASIVLAAGHPRRRWLLVTGAAASALGWVAMLRNLTPLVAPFADLNNIVLPVWMMMLGVVLARSTGDDVCLEAPRNQ